MNNNRNAQITSINQLKFNELASKNKRLQLQIRNIKTAVKRIVATTALVGTIIGFGAGYMTAKNNSKQLVPFIPDDFVAMDIDICINKGDNVSTIASEYYNDNYKGMYSDFKTYQEAIKEKNSLNDNYDITTDKDLIIPVVFEKDNKYYMEMNSLQNNISGITNSDEYWVPYTVTSSDSSIGYLAAKSSGSEAETIKAVKSITRHNKLDTTTIRPGDTIEIINPELGPLKISLSDAKDNFAESIKNNSEIKEK